MTQLRILASHPIQYYVPFYRALVERGLNIEVCFYHTGTAGRVGYDPEFGLDIQWDVDLTSGYPHRIFLNTQATYKLLEQLKIAPKLLFWSLRDRKVPLLLSGWFVELIWFVWLIRILLGAPVIITGDNTPQSFGLFPKPAWRLMILKWLLKNTSAVFYFGQRNRDFWINMGVPNDRLFHTPHSVDGARFAYLSTRLFSERRELCRQYGLNHDLPTFLFCGKLISKKRPVQLLDAYLSAGLADKAQLLFVGDGALRPELERRIQALQLKNVHLLGFLNQSEMPLA